MSAPSPDPYDALGLPYRVAVLCYLYDELGRLLLLHRRKLPNSDMYSPIGGKVEIAQGESPHDCAAREVREEAGIAAAATDMQLTGIVAERAYQGQAHWLLFCFEFCRTLGAKEIPEREFEEGRLEWVPVDEVARKNIPQIDSTVLWPLIQRHRGGFFVVDVDCSTEPPRATVRESRGAAG